MTLRSRHLLIQSSQKQGIIDPLYDLRRLLIVLVAT
jgi:hypothetical protein